ncbi:zinc finger BED domain-containing protein RICESLEEPER 3-like [Amaranthus tricolor]|uniref:zinc finger BED domain-containing protein RICESLEEPER 3-like n=1 Tax=Amaranthus tricolor TaxID=29722 RepID=UPI00258620C1|nr:zinc finger BED domain-containing protein RICESLEEPER 3-like [Amaranthus tricolor]
MPSKGTDHTIGASTNSKSKPSTTASCTPISVDEYESPANIVSEPNVLPITSKHTSAVWNDFKRKRVGGVEKAECNRCNKLLSAGAKARTSHLKDHIKSCRKQICQDLRQTTLFGTQHNVNDSSDSLTLAPYEFRQEDGRKDLAEMIILHEYPISMI